MRLLDKTAAVLVVAVCFYAAFTLLFQSFATYKAFPVNGDPVGISEERVLRAKPFLAGNTDIGYIAELDYNGARAREFQRLDVEHIGRYYLTQYALAPTRVFHSTDYPTVIAHFLEDTSQATRARTAGAEGLSLIKDFGDGVMLYRRE